MLLCVSISALALLFLQRHRVYMYHIGMLLFSPQLIHGYVKRYDVTTASCYRGSVIMVFELMGLSFACSQQITHKQQSCASCIVTITYLSLISLILKFQYKASIKATVTNTTRSVRATTTVITTVVLWLFVS